MERSSQERLRHLLAKVPGEYWRAPADASAVASLQEWLRSVVGLDLPAEYVDLLSVSDGLQIANDQVLSVEDCRWENHDLYEDARYHDYILLGREGNDACWAYEFSSRRFLISGFSNPDEAFEVHESLCDLIESRIALLGEDAGGSGA